MGLVPAHFGFLRSRWGRWFAVISINFAIVALCKELGRLELSILPSEKRWFENFTDTGEGTSPLLAKRNGALLLAILLFVVIFIRLPHCCISSSELRFLADPLGKALETMVQYMLAF